MNLNEIYERVQKFDLRAAVDEIRSAGHVLTQTEMTALIVTAVAGILICLFGLKLVRLWAALLGLAAGFAAGAGVSVTAGLDIIPAVIIGGAAGLILAALGAALYRVGVFITVFLAVGLFGVRMIDPQNWMMLAICAGVALVAAILAVKFVTLMTILATVIFGAVTAGPAVYCFLPETVLGDNLSIILCAAFGALGMIVQLLLESRKRKRQNLKKAAEIREENSTANEVERARAMMEELDTEKSGGQDSVSREISGTDGDEGLQTVSLDDIEDIDEEE